MCCTWVGGVAVNKRVTGMCPPPYILKGGGKPARMRAETTDATGEPKRASTDAGLRPS